MAVGHVRYSTTGRSVSANAQPFLVRYKGHDVALAHNGNLVNAGQLRQDLEDEGAIFATGNDTEVFMHLLVRALRHNDMPGRHQGGLRPRARGLLSAGHDGRRAGGRARSFWLSPLGYGAQKRQRGFCFRDLRL